MDRIRLAVDVSGGDFGASVLVEGLVEAYRREPGAFQARLCGDGEEIAGLLARYGLTRSAGTDAWADGLITVEHCADAIVPEDVPTRVWKSKPHSSIVRCVALQKERKADASISAGDTGALMSAALFILGRQKHVGRPALAALLPTTGANHALLLDAGANSNCRPDHLASFAMLGETYMRRFYGLTAPRVALLNIGTEPTKGTRTVADAAELVRRQCPGYRGFIEGSRILAGDADVVVCDGFVGNVLLKAFESFYRLTESALSAASPQVIEAIRKHMAVFNAELYGAVPLLGINGVVLKAHGSSTTTAFASAVGMAVAVVQRHAILDDSPKGKMHSHVQ